MISNANAATAVNPLLPPSLPTELTDSELLLATRRLVGRSNQLLAALLAHLGEVEARGVHRTRACASLYTYCIYELRFSEDEAFRRVSAARLVRRFPVLLDAIAAGELHLTGLLMLGPHLTAENLDEVLARAKHRTKKEISKLVRVLDPLPEVPATIEPLGPAPARAAGLVPKTPTWTEWVDSLCPVRNLVPGDRPRDWVDPIPASANDGEFEQASSAGATRDGAGDTARDSAAPARLEPQRYAVQFTASEEYVKLVDQARALLSHSQPGISLDELHLRAMQALVAELQRKKYAVPPPSRREPSPVDADTTESTRKIPLRADVSANEPGAKQPSARPSRGAAPRRRGERMGSGGREAQEAAQSQKTGARSRHIPAAVRRAVYECDSGRCTYASASGQRCAETHCLELHHLEPFARDGEHTQENLTLRCPAHNALAAEHDFGRGFMQDGRRAANHESWATEGKQS